jgi:hypothetical protein
VICKKVREGGRVPGWKVGDVGGGRGGGIFG